MSKPTSNTQDKRTDQELITAINDRDHEAFAVLYYRYRDWVVRLAFRFTQNHTLALDVLQDTFVYFFKKFPDFTLSCQLKTFLYPAVRNLSLTALKKAQQFTPDPATLDAMSTPVSPLESTSSARRQLEDILAPLSHEHRETLLLRYVDGLNLQEISQAMKVPLGTVKSRIHHALQVLRRDSRTQLFFNS